MSTPKTRAQALAAHQALAGRYTEILHRHTEQALDLTAAVIATVDGIEIASLAGKPGLRPAQLAAMASSLMAVAVAAGREVGHGPCERLFIETRAGTLLLKPIGRAGDLVLCMALTPRTVLAKAFWAADEIGRAVATS
ncbi:roadblock/LC7 domain-containing protein [Variovorax sp. KK3]|uniref:roadblock/LC7 domain-containing protein n=1 Tax=Variovorax sp. KK3 TaxID=1855728 RepID=UPI00097BB3A8|nr:roadblock/LC7 domain-containing protein [Variovorax sp. KK3]